MGREREERETRSADGFEAWWEMVRGNTACERAADEVEAIAEEGRNFFRSREVLVTFLKRNGFLSVLFSFHFFNFDGENGTLLVELFVDDDG